MKDQVVLIVGASGGIGAATANIFANAGSKLVLAARNEEKAQVTAQQINANNGEASVVGVDVTKLSSVSAMAREVYEKHGQIDVLVNAFGLGVIKPLLDINPDTAKEVMDVNVYGTFLVTQTVMRYMETAGKGRVIMFPGILGKNVMKNTSVYAATKFAVTGFAKALTEEQRKGKVKFSLMYLGGVATPFWDDENVDMKVKKDFMLTPEEVAEAVYYAASQPQKSAMNEITIQPESHQMV